MRTGLRVDVSVQTAAWRRGVPGPVAVCRRAAAAALAAAGEPAGGVEVSVVLADDGFVRALNRDYRGRDRPTNVLAFASRRGARAPARRREREGAAAAPLLLGDVVVAHATAAAEARARGKSLGDHLSRLVVHGVLHLVGLDHGRRAAAREMRRVEREALAALGLALPCGGGSR